MWRNGIKCKYMFLFPLKNLARVVLILPEAIVKSILSRDYTNIYSSLLPDPVTRQDVVHLVNTLPKLADPVVDIVHEANGQVTVHASWTYIGRMHAGTTYTLVELTELIENNIMFNIMSLWPSYTI